VTIIDDIKDTDSEFYRKSPCEQVLLLGGRDLTEQARLGGLGRAFGYGPYVAQVLASMAHRRSVLLLGPANVGKTAILHEALWLMVSGQASRQLRGAYVFDLPISTLISGCRYYGDWEAKLEALLRTLREIPGAYIYMNDIWRLRQAGTAEHQSDGFATFLQPYLERREVTLLGEATPESYNGPAMGDGHEIALANVPSVMRLFTLITVVEPTAEEAQPIVMAAAAELERTRRVRIPGAAVERCLSITRRFQRGLALPGKAIALLEETVRAYQQDQQASSNVAAAPNGTPNNSSNGAGVADEDGQGQSAAQRYAARAAHFAEQAALLEQEATAALGEALDTEGGLSSADDDISSLVAGILADSDDAGPGSGPWPPDAPSAQATPDNGREQLVSRKMGDASSLEAQARLYRDVATDYSEWAARLNAPPAPPDPVRTGQAEPSVAPPADSSPAVITPAMIMATFAGQSHLPTLLFSDSDPLRRDEVLTFFAERMVGQEEAVAAIVDLIMVIKAELTDPAKPLGVLLLAGPTGTGKTWLATILADYLFGSPDALLRFDMSEFAYPGSAPALAAQIVQKMRQRSFTVLLLDEIEKADPTVFDLFLQVFDAGRLSDLTGAVVDLRSAIIILTSNLGSDLTALTSNYTIGFASSTAQPLDPHRALVDAVEDAVSQRFRPEFINRLDNIVVFHALDNAAIRRIAQRELGRAIQREGLTRRKIVLTFEDAVLDVLIEQGFNPVYGARPLLRAIKRLVLGPLAEQIAAHPTLEQQTLTLHVEEGRITVVGSAARPPVGPLPRTVAPPPVEQADDGIIEPPRPLRRDPHRLSTAVGQLASRIAARMSSPAFGSLQDESAALLEQTWAPSFWDDRRRATQIYRRIYDLERITDHIAGLRGRVEELAEDAAALRLEGSDWDSAQVARLEDVYDTLEGDLDLAELQLLAATTEDERSDGAFIRISSADREPTPEDDEWRQDLHDMYSAWSQRMGYDVETLTEPGGTERLLVVRGLTVAVILRGEAGIHQQTRRDGDAPGHEYHRAVQRARVEILPLVLRAPDDQPFRAEELRLVTRAVTQAHKGPHALQQVEASARGVSVHLIGQDAPELAVTLLAARLLSPPTEAEEVVRVYTTGRERWVRDPRTGVRSNDPRDILDGALDPFLVGYMRQAGTVVFGV